MVKHFLNCAITFEINMKPTTFFFMVAMVLIVSAVRAEMYKWTDADGAVHYGDAPPTSNANRVKTTDNTVQGCNDECWKKIITEAVNNGEIKDSSCKFLYRVRDGEYAEGLARAAKQECLTNKAMQERFSGYAPESEAYDRWQRYYQEMSIDRNRRIDQALQTHERQMDQIQRRREADELNTKLDRIGDRQENIEKKPQRLEDCIKGTPYCY